MAHCFCGGKAGLFSAVGLVILSPAVWVKVLGNAQAYLPLRSPSDHFNDLGFHRNFIVLSNRQERSCMKAVGAFEEQYIARKQVSVLLALTIINIFRPKKGALAPFIE